jgi:hypothetical protein
MGSWVVRSFDLTFLRAEGKLPSKIGGRGSRGDHADLGHLFEIRELSRARSRRTEIRDLVKRDHGDRGSKPRRSWLSVIRELSRPLRWVSDGRATIFQVARWISTRTYLRGSTPRIAKGELRHRCLGGGRSGHAGSGVPAA